MFFRQNLISNSMLMFLCLALSTQMKVQVYSYFQSVLCEDVENQRLGLVSLALPGEHFAKINKLPSRFDRYKLTRFILSCPLRFCAIHCCYPDTPVFRLIKAAYAVGMHTSESTRFRMKFHTGTIHNFELRCCIDITQRQILSINKI